MVGARRVVIVTPHDDVDFEDVKVGPQDFRNICLCARKGRNVLAILGLSNGQPFNRFSSAIIAQVAFEAARRTYEAERQQPPPLQDGDSGGPQHHEMDADDGQPKVPGAQDVEALLKETQTRLGGQ